MSPRSKKEYLDVVHPRYKHASKKEKTAILDEFCQVCGYHRKHAIRLLRKYKRFTKPKPKKKGRKPIYDKKALLKTLKEIWLKANLPCSKRLKAILPLWLPGYVKIHGILPEKVINDLLSLSPATIDRFLQHTRIRYNKRGQINHEAGNTAAQEDPYKH